MLFVVMLGGKHPRAKIEVHDIAFVIADSLEEAYPQLKQDWFGSPVGLHIDAWMAVDGVEGWKLAFSASAPGPGSMRLYFINLGGYESETFGEAHHYALIVAKDKREAMSLGKRQAVKHWAQAHTDGVLNVDDCLPIDAIDGRYVHLVEEAHNGIIQCNEYIVLS